VQQGIGHFDFETVAARQRWQKLPTVAWMPLRRAAIAAAAPMPGYVK
jgi:hypothetical protein